LLELVWRKERATPGQIALVVLLLVAPTVLLVPCPGVPDLHSRQFAYSTLVQLRMRGELDSIWAPGTFAGALATWIAIIGATSAFAVIVRHARFGQTRAPELRVAYWTLPAIVLLAVVAQSLVRLFRFQSMGWEPSWISAPLLLAPGPVLAVLAFLASRRGPTSGLVALALGEWIARDASLVLANRADIWFPIIDLLRLTIFAVTALVLSRVDTRPDDLPRAGLGWAAQPADVVLAPWGVGWLASELVTMRAMIAESHVAADPLSSSLSSTSMNFWTVLSIAQRAAFWLAWALAIPALARWITWTRAHSQSPEAEPSR
jgi:hypothetical protein